MAFDAEKSTQQCISKRLGNRGFHDLFIHCFFSKHNEYCKTEAKDIWVNIPDFKAIQWGKNVAQL